MNSNHDANIPCQKHGRSVRTKWPLLVLPFYKSTLPTPTIPRPHPPKHLPLPSPTIVEALINHSSCDRAYSVLFNDVYLFSIYSFDPLFPFSASSTSSWRCSADKASRRPMTIPRGTAHMARVKHPPRNNHHHQPRTQRRTNKQHQLPTNTRSNSLHNLLMTPSHPPHQTLLTLPPSLQHPPHPTPNSQPHWLPEHGQPSKTSPSCARTSTMNSIKSTPSWMMPLTY